MGLFGRWVHRETREPMVKIKCERAFTQSDVIEIVAEAISREDRPDSERDIRTLLRDEITSINVYGDDDWRDGLDEEEVEEIEREARLIVATYA